MGFLHTVSKLSGNICQKSQIYPHRHRQLVHSDSIADTMVHHQVEQSTSSHSARWRSRLHDYAKPGLALVTFWWHQFAGRWLIDDCNVVSMVAAVALCYPAYFMPLLWLVGVIITSSVFYHAMLLSSVLMEWSAC